MGGKVGEGWVAHRNMNRSDGEAPLPFTSVKYCLKMSFSLCRNTRTAAALTFSLVMASRYRLLYGTKMKQMPSSTSTGLALSVSSSASFSLLIKRSTALRGMSPLQRRS